MSEKRKYLVKSICFLLLFLMLFQLVSNILQEKWVDYNTMADTYIIKQYNNLKKNSIELAVLGSSETISGVSCMQLLDQYGISAFSSSTSSQPMICTYYYAKQFIKNQSLKAAIIDVSMLYEKVQVPGFRRVSDTTPFSLEKMKMIWNFAAYRASKKGFRTGLRAFWSYLFPIMQYHDRWESLSRTDFGQQLCGPFVFRGNTSLIRKEAVTDIILEEKKDSDPDERPDTDQLYWFRKTLEAFADADVPVLLIKTPKYDWTNSRMRGVQALAEEFNLDYLDFNTRELFYAAALDLDEDFWNPEHLNYSGALKLSDYLADYLNKRISFTETALTDADRSDLDAFHRLLRKNQFMLTENADAFLECISDVDCTLLLQIDAGTEIPDQLQKLISSIGFHAVQEGVRSQNYLGHAAGGIVVFEQYSDGAPDYSSRLPSGLLLTTATENGGACTLLLDGTPVTFSAPGIHLILCADDYQQMGRAVTLTVDDNGSPVIIKNNFNWNSLTVSQ